jgi:hypothetical protein
MGPSATSV